MAWVTLMMERSQRRKRERKEGGGQGRSEASTNEPHKECATAVNPRAEQTYLQRLNKTSLCQTKRGMAGHSLRGLR